MASATCRTSQSRRSQVTAHSDHRRSEYLGSARQEVDLEQAGLEGPVLGAVAGRAAFALQNVQDERSRLLIKGDQM